MKLKRKHSRKNKLREEIEHELNQKYPDIHIILECIDTYELDNLATIEKLKKDKVITTNKIKGGLRQTINAHGPITMLLIGSATKRIYGSLLASEEKVVKKGYSMKKISLGLFLLGIIIYTLIKLL